MIDPLATPKDYKIILYSKTEIDAMNLAEKTRIDSELLEKVDSQWLGSPIGVSTLDPHGKIDLVQLPIASAFETEDSLESTKLMTPERTHQLLNDYTTTNDSDTRYGDLDSDGSTTMQGSYTPIQLTDIATVKYVQDTVSSTATTYTRATLAQMLSISPLNIGDVCFVTADGTNNGEYIATTASLGGSVLVDWSKRSNETAWGTIIGNIVDQINLMDEFDLKTNVTVTDDILTKTDLISVFQPVDLDTMEASILLNTAKVSYFDENVVAQNVLDIENNKLITDAIISGDQILRSIRLADLSTVPPVYAEGQMYYANGVSNIQGKYSDVNLQVGREQHVEVINNTPSTIVNGKPVRHDGVSGGETQIALAQADTFTNAKVIGVTTHDIASGSKGLITISGLVGLDTTSFAPTITTLYLSESVAGEYVSIAPDIITEVATINKNSIDGEILVSIDNLVSKPTVFANLSDGVIATSMTGGVSYPIRNFLSSARVVMDVNQVAGIIKVKDDGEYRMSFTIGLRFNQINNSEDDFFVSLKANDGSYGRIFTFAISRNSAVLNASMNALVPLVGGKDYILEVIAENNLQNVVTDHAEFSMTSVHIR